MKCKVTGEVEGRIVATGTVMVVAPARARIELVTQMPGTPKATQVMISDVSKAKMLCLFPEAKLALVTQKVNVPKEEMAENWFLEIRSLLLAARDKPDVRRESLGEKDSEGRRVVGYRFSGPGLGPTRMR